MALKILPIFGSKNEVLILQLIKNHLALVKKASETFVAIARLAFQGNFNDVINKAQNVDDIEKEADDVKREIESALYRGAFLPTTRSNLYALIEKQDQVCNQIQNASNMFIYLKNRKPSKEVEIILKQLVEEASKSVQNLERIVHALVSEKKDIVKDVEEMREIEKGADIIQRRLFSTLLLSKKKMDPVSVNFFGSFGHALSEICDEVKSTCDFVALMFILKQA